MALSKATLIDLNSNELILDLDADTSITADTDDTIHIKIAGSDELTLTTTAIAPSTSDGQALGTSSLMFSDLFLASGSVLNFNNGDVTLTHASNLLTLDGGSLDLDGEALILDTDGDTKLVESSDDVIHLQFAGSTSTPTEFGAGYMNLKNQGTRSYIRFYCESSNAHYTELRAAAHSDYSGNVQVTLPVTAGTLATLTGTETFTNKTLTTPVIAEIDSGSTITLDATTDIVLDADGGDIIFKDDGTTIATFTNSSTDLIIETATSDKDIIFKVNDGGSSTEVMRVDGDVSALLMASGKEIRFADSGEKISGNGTDLTLNSGADINLTATADVNIPSGVGVTFGDDGEKIEGDGTDLTIASSAKINLTATSDVHIPNNVGIVFGGDSEKIEGDGTDMTISANNLTIDAAADISFDAAGNDFKFLAGGTEILNITNSSSDVVIKPIVDAKDIIIQQRDGTSLVEFNDGAYSKFTAMAYNPEATLTDASTISWNVLTSPVAKVTLGANRTLVAGSGAIAVQFVSLLVIQVGTGSRTLSFNAAFEFKDDTAPTLTTTASKGDLFVFRYNGSKFLEVGRNQNLTLS